MDEVWKQIEDFPDYEVSNHGRVRSNKFCKTRIMKQYKTPLGYLDVCLTMSGKSTSVRVHRLVLETFVGNRPDNMEASHLDGSRDNNHVNNLVWESRTDNNRRCSHVKLNTEKAKQIRLMSRNGWNGAKLARKFGVSESTIYYIRHNKYWKGVE